MKEHLDSESREALRKSPPETITGYAQPTYFHVGPVTGDYVYDINGRNSIHIHVTLYAPIDIRPIQKALAKRFGGFRRCDMLLFETLAGKAGEAGIIHAEIDIPLLPVSIIEDFVKRLIMHVYKQHMCYTADTPRPGMGPLGRPLQALQVR